MTPETAKGILDFLLPQLQQESATTSKVLAAVPAAGYDYKPSEKCMSAIDLAAHIATSEAFFLKGVISGGFEWKPTELKTPAEVVSYYQETIPALIEQLGQLSGEQLAKPVTFAVWTEPAITFLSLQLKHGIHHRGQLSAYLRPMGAKVPSIYGPSADEPLQSAAGQ